VTELTFAATEVAEGYQRRQQRQRGCGCCVRHADGEAEPVLRVPDADDVAGVAFTSQEGLDRGQVIAFW
jgi:hypothetical protein